MRSGSLGNSIGMRWAAGGCRGMRTRASGGHIDRAPQGLPATRRPAGSASSRRLEPPPMRLTHTQQLHRHPRRQPRRGRALRRPTRLPPPPEAPPDRRPPSTTTDRPTTTDQPATTDQTPPRPLVHGLTVTVTGDGAGHSEPSGIRDCSETCWAEFPAAQPVVLRADAFEGSTFGGWGWRRVRDGRRSRDVQAEPRSATDRRSALHT